MPCARQYTINEINDILQQSEGRLSPVSNQPGHALHLHVDARGEQLSDRFLRPSASAVGRAYIVGEHGEIATAAETRAAWNDYAAATGGAQMNRATFNREFERWVPRLPAASGAFADRQDAIAVATHVLNSALGQGELAALDAGTRNRVQIQSPVPPQVNGGTGVQMYLSEAVNSIPRIVPVRQVFMLVDRLGVGGIHVQTFYPVA